MCRVSPPPLSPDDLETDGVMAQRDHELLSREGGNVPSIKDSERNTFNIPKLCNLSTTVCF
jgi:hypothetical protein